MDNTSIITEITNRATETADRFIFETIAPFCSQVTQRMIEKAELEQALLHYYPKDRIESVHGVQRFYICPTCGNYITRNQNACDNCGQRLNDMP